MAKYNAKEVIDLVMTDETVYDESEDEEFDGYISDSVDEISSTLLDKKVHTATELLQFFSLIIKDYWA